MAHNVVWHIVTGGGVGADFDNLMRQIGSEARAEGPEAVAELEMLGAQLRLAADLFGRRRQLGLSQAALSRRCGVPQADISRIERGLGNPTMSTVGKLVSALGGGSVGIAWNAR